MDHTTFGLNATRDTGLNTTENISKDLQKVNRSPESQSFDSFPEVTGEIEKGGLSTKATVDGNAKKGETSSRRKREVARATVAIQEAVLARLAPPDGSIRGLGWFSVFLNGNTKEADPPGALLDRVIQLQTAKQPIQNDSGFSDWVHAIYRNDRLIKPNYLKWAILYFRRENPEHQHDLGHKALAEFARNRVPDLTDEDHRVIASSMNYGQDSVEAEAKRRKLLTELAERRQLAQEQSKEVSESVVRGLLANEAIPRPEVVYAITQRLLDLKLLPPSGDTLPPDNDELASLQAALEAYFDVNKVSVDKFQRDAIGDYFLYRPSLHIPGHFVKALLTIDKNEVGRARVVAPLRVTENHLYQGGSEGDAAVTEKWIGVMSRKSGTPYMLSCQRSTKESETDSNHGVSRGPPRFTLFHSVLYDNSDGNVASMTGITLSPFAGGYTMALPVCIERIRDKKIIEHARAECTFTADNLHKSKILGVFSGDAKKPSKIPLSVQGRLDRAKSNIREGWQATIT